MRYLHWLMYWASALTALASGQALAQFNSLSALPNSVFVSTPTTVKFVADLPADPKLIRASVTLLRESGGVFQIVGTMRDDGLGGDDVANDGRFTHLLAVNAAQVGSLNFRASAAYSGSAQRVQSSVLPVAVTAPAALSITPGQQEITIVQGQSASTAFTIQIANQGGGGATAAVNQAVTPNTGLNVVTDLPSGGFASNSVNQTFLVQDQFTGVAPGEYTVTLSGKLQAGAGQAQDSASLTVRVLSSSGIGAVDLTAHPGGLKTGSSATINFSALYSVGTTLPSAVQLLEVTQAGDPLQLIGFMLDDGVTPDILAADRIFSLASVVSSGAAGTARYFRAVAQFAGGATAASAVVGLLSLPFEIGFLPVNPSSIVLDPATGQSIVCDQVLMAVKPGTSLSTIQGIAASIGASVIAAEPWINTYQLRVPCQSAAAIQAIVNGLNQNPGVAGASPNGISEVGEFKPNDPSFASQAQFRHVRADEAWLIARGKAVPVAVLDTGVDYNHEDLVGRVTKGKDYVNNDNDPQDDHSHGTHVAGIVAAKGHNGKGIAGIAWDAHIVAIKVCGGLAGVPGVGVVTGCPFSAQVSGILEAMTKAKILNMSLGGTGSSFLVGLAIAAANAAGRLVVVAAGNSNTSTPFYPCAHAGGLCVGNSTVSDTRWGSSNYGSHVDIAAPGVTILSTVPSFTSATGYATKTGTSMAAPLIAGAAALVWGNNPSWTRAQVQDRLVKTAVAMPGQQIGPRVDVFDAVFNGSFEHEMSGWTVVGTGRAVDKLGPISPTKDKRMGMASTGPDGTVSASEISQAFTIQADVTELAISFNYAMVTEEYPEWVNRGFNDHFIITLVKPGGSTQQLAIETVDGSSFSAIGGIDFPGGDHTVGWTGWKNVTSVKIPVTPGGGTYRLRVEDRGDGIFDTNGLLDNIRFK
jgi:subtilisin family serine protease